MSAANVSFVTESEERAYPGLEQMFYFTCPRNGHACGPLLIAGRTAHKRDGQNRDGGRAQWDWDGDADTPTFTPSVNFSHCWHGYIRNGRCVDVNGGDEPEPERRE
jgi:hypothetical protein